MKISVVSTFLTLVLVACLGTIASASNLQRARVDSGKTTIALPAGDWGFSARPYGGSDWNVRPVMVVSVSTDAAKGLAIDAVGIVNLSNKNATAVKFRVELARSADGTSTRYQSDFISRAGGFPSDRNQVNLDVMLFRFVDVIKPLTENGRLSGEFIANVVVSDVQFDDGTTWTDTSEAARGNGSIKRVTFTSSLQPLVVEPFVAVAACANQACNYLPDPPLPGYDCANNNPNQFCTNCGTSCCNTICGHSPACNCN